MKKENQVPATTQSTVTTAIANLPEVRSFERLVFINEDTGEASDKPKEGYMPMLVPKYIYQDGLPLQYQIDLKDAIFGQVGEDKANFKPVNELVFTPLAVFEFGNVCMYPQKDPATGQRSCKQRNMVSVVAYIPNLPHIVSFLLPTWTASNFLREYKKSGRVTPAGIPVTSPLQLQFKAVKYQETSASGTKVWAVKFDVQIMPPKYFKELAEFAQGHVFYAAEHIVEVMSNAVNGISANNPTAWLRKLKTAMPENIFAELIAIANDRRYQNSGEVESEEYQDFEVVPSAVEPPRAEVPAERVANFYRNYEECMPYMSIEERQELSIKYSISHNDFVVKGKKLLAIMEEIKSGVRTVESDPTNDLPW